MNKLLKILLGLATIWPFAYILLFFFFVFSSFFFVPGPGDPESGPPLFFLVLFPLHILTMLWIMALTVFYIVNVFRNERVDKDKKVLWAVVLFMGDVIHMQIYWYFNIWKEPAITRPGPAALDSGDQTVWVNNAKASSGAAAVCASRS